MEAIDEVVNDKKKRDYRNLSLIVLSISLCGSTMFIKTTKENILNIEEEIIELKGSYKTEQSILDNKKANMEQLKYIEKYYPTQDVEKTLFSFLAYIVNEANSSKYKLDSFLVDYSSLNEKGNLVDIKLKVKGYGGSLETGLFLHKIKQIKFSDVEGMKLSVDEETGKTEGIIDLVITSKKTTYNDELANPLVLSSIADIKTDIMGNWVKFESVKKQLRMLRENGLTADSLLDTIDTPKDIVVDKSSNTNNKIEVQLDGFEEITEEKTPSNSKPVIKTPETKPVTDKDKQIEKAKGFSSPLKTVNILEKYTLETPRLLLEAKQGTKVMAMDVGRVVYKGTLSEYGECIFIEHSDGSTTIYSGLKDILVSTSQDISKGQVIATTGIYEGKEGLGIGLTTKEGNFIDPTVYLK